MCGQFLSESCSESAVRGGVYGVLECLQRCKSAGVKVQAVFVTATRVWQEKSACGQRSLPDVLLILHGQASFICFKIARFCRGDMGH